MSSDFVCESCGHEFEELYTRGEESTVSCPACDSFAITKQLAAPNIAGFSIKSPEDRAASLKKRSEDHTKREVAREPERFGAEGIKRQQQGKKPMVGG